MKIAFGEIPRMLAQRLGAHTVALQHGTTPLSWGDLDVRSTRRAWAMKTRGVAAGDLVTLALPNCNELFECTFAAWKLGATPHCVSWRLPAAEIAEILHLAKPKAFISAALEDVPRELNALPANFGLEDGKDDRLPPIISTYWKAMSSGGSTGRPKIIVDHRPGVFDPEVRYLGVGDGEVVLNPGPLYHNAPFAMSHQALFRGNQLVSMAKFDAEEALRLIDRWKVTSVNFVPTMMLRIWRLPDEVKQKYDLSSIRNLWHMGGPMPVWLKQAWIDWIGADKVNEAYAGTEHLGSTVIRGPEWLTHQGSVGRPVGCRVLILGEDGKELPAGEVGEIFFQRDTQEKLFHYIGSERRDTPEGYESLGDFGWLDEEGYLYLADRRTDLVVSGGANVYPAEVEAALLEHPGVQMAVVIGLPHEDLGASVHAIVQKSAAWSGEMTAQTLVDFLAARLVRYKIPRSFEFTTSELRDESGKVRRSKLRQERMGRGSA